jgi:hypothetical protein
MSRDMSSRVAVFPSKRDWWITALMWGIAITVWAGDLRALPQTPPGVERVTAMVAGLLAGLGVLWLWATTGYRVTDSSLHLHSGPLHMELPLGRSVRVSRTRRLRGVNVALLRDVLRIELEGSAWAYHVSPLDRPGFVSALAERCGHLAPDGDGLRTRGKTPW